MMEVPEGWVQAVDRRVGNLRITEYYPSSTHRDWTEKITIEALMGEDLPDPLVFAQGLAAEQAEVCSGFSDDGIFSGFENAYPTTVHMMQCPQNKRSGRALLTMIKIIKGNHALYTITRIWRLPPLQSDELDDSFPPMPIDEAVVGGWSHVLSKIHVCDDALSAHSCSTTEVKDP